MGNETRERLERDRTWRLREPLFRLWIYPSQGNNTSWTLLSPRHLVEGGTPLLREVTWSRRQDEDQNDKPTLRIRDTEISAWEQDSYRDIVERLRPPPLPEHHDVPTGAHTGIEGFGALRSVRMEWQGAGPVEWSETIGRVTRLRNLMMGTRRAL